MYLDQLYALGLYGRPWWRPVAESSVNKLEAWKSRATSRLIISHLLQYQEGMGIYSAWPQTFGSNGWTPSTFSTTTTQLEITPSAERVTETYNPQR